MNIQQNISAKEINAQSTIAILPENMTDISWLLKLTSESAWEKDKKKDLM